MAGGKAVGPCRKGGAEEGRELLYSMERPSLNEVRLLKSCSRLAL